ncbi:hypothetical protein PAHAL_9G136300 [Panicum hallii]|uniref:DUF4283 domain-containing protein n=1 Tax=Panicum hallii TaxID=206008 RepID=A0A2S3IJC8_9POAL|nr:hypothetical protein PAHAL_9G136300 [Panicum hallii]
MQSGSGSAHPTSLPEEEVDVPGRPDFVDRQPPHPGDRVTPERERRTSRPETAVVYLPAPRPEMLYFARCFAYAYITPEGAPCKASPAPFIRAAIGAALPGLRFELTPPAYGADRTVRFATPEDREAAMERQPFALDGASVRLDRGGETSNVRRVSLDILAHVALLGYPREQRSEEDIRSNGCGFGHLLEVDPACYAAPDLSPVRAVLAMEREHVRNTPRQVRIRYSDFRSRHVVPVRILRVWDWSESTDANGEYVPVYPAAAAP